MAEIRTNPKLLQEERRLATKIARHLKKLSDAIANKLESLDSTKWLIEDILVDFDLYFGEIADDIVLHDSRVRDLNERIQLRNLKRLGMLWLIDIEQIREAKEVYLEATKNLILSTQWGVIPTTVNRVREIVADGVTTGQSYTQIAKTIREQAQAWVFSKERAKLIAVNQTKLAYELAWTQPYQQLVANWVMVRKQRLTVKDDRVTPTHTQNEEEWWIHYNDTFSGTGDFLPPATDNPRCRCTIKYEVNGES